MAVEINDIMPIRVKDGPAGIGYETAVENVVANLDKEVGSTAFQTATNKLRDQYDAAKEIESAMLKLLLPRSKDKTMAGLNKKLSQFSKEVSLFTGPALDANIVSKYRSVLGSKAAEAQVKIQEGYRKWVESLTDAEIAKYFPNNTYKYTDLKNQLFLDFMNQWYDKGAKFSVTRGAKGNRLTSRKRRDIILQIFGISFKDLTITQWQRLVEKYVSKDDKISRVDTKEEGDTKTTTTVTIESNVDLYTLPSKKAQELYDQNALWPNMEGGRPFRDIVKEVNTSMINLLCDYAQRNGKATDTSPSKIMREVVNEMLKLEPMLFFFGGNPQDIVGRLGEISANYLMRRMFPTVKKITWNAEQRIRGKQAHRDLIVEFNNEFNFGLQIKNTLKEAVGNVGFEHASISHWLDVAEISGDLRDAVESFYALRTFNVPYTLLLDENKEIRRFIGGTTNKRYKKKTHMQYKRVSSPDQAWECSNKKAYIDSYKKLSEAVKTVEFLLYTSVAAVMFLQVGTQIDANSLFLLGNQTFVSAAQILGQILKELEEFQKGNQTTRSLRVARTTDEKADNKNIVDYFNNRDRDIRSGIRGSIMDEIILTSSFDFSQWTKTLKS